MKNEKDKIDELKKQGYENVIVWDKVTAFGSVDHSHSFDTRIVVLSGEIEISINGQTRVLKTSDEIDIPRDTLHHAKAGPSGCRYISAEKY
jgi:hypothetical protein